MTSLDPGKPPTSAFETYDRVANSDDRWEPIGTIQAADPAGAALQACIKKWHDGKHFILVCHEEGAWEFQVDLTLSGPTV